MPDNRNIINFGLGLKTEWEVTLTDSRTGKIKQYIPWHKNKILDDGLNERLSNTARFWSGTSSSIFPYIAVGTGNVAPEYTDLALGTERARKILNTSLCSYGVSPANAPYFIIGTQWGTTEANYDLTEVALCKSVSGGILWSRDLFRDEFGVPTIVSKENTDILTVKCKTTIERTSEDPYTPVTLDGRSVTGIILNSGLQDATGRGSSTPPTWWSSDSWYAGTSNAAPSATQTGLIGTNLGSSSNLVWSAAHEGPGDGGFYRDATITFLSYQPVNASCSIGEVVGGIGAGASYTVLKSRHTFDAAIVKDTDYQLAFTVRVTLSRT